MIGAGFPTSPTLWTYAYQIFDGGVIFDRVRLDIILGGHATAFGVSTTLGQPGGVSPSVIHLFDPTVQFSNLPAADFSPPISGAGFTSVVYFTSPLSPYPAGTILLGNGAEPLPNPVLIGFGGVITPVPAPTVGGALLLGTLLGARRRR